MLTVRRHERGLPLGELGRLSASPATVARPRSPPASTMYHPSVLVRLLPVGLVVLYSRDADLEPGADSCHDP